jgi:hypothetical protein
MAGEGTTMTTDLCDAHEEKLQAGDLRVLSPPGLFNAYGKLKVFAGPTTTLKVSGFSFQNLLAWIAGFVCSIGR